MMVSVYVPHRPVAELQPRLDKIRAAWEDVQTRYREKVELVIAGDFNRHD